MAAACLAAVPAASARPLLEAGPVPAAAPASRAELVEFARGFLGTPYRYGGASPGGFDCSGLTSYVYARYGVRMDHYTGGQYAAFPKVARSALAPGDLVFFDGLGHSGIYVGDGRFIHATHSGDVVRISRMTDSWYRERYDGAVRPPFPSTPSTSGPSTTRSEGTRAESSSASSA